MFRKAPTRGQESKPQVSTPLWRLSYGFAICLRFVPFNVNGHDKVIIPRKSGFVCYVESNFIMLVKPPLLTVRKVTFLYDVHFSFLMYVTSKFLAQLKS